ncbi:MAG: thioredoxin [Halobacteria archaeon]|nr:thioredoxin [Halobacteria archaeon]
MSQHEDSKSSQDEKEKIREKKMKEMMGEGSDETAETETPDEPVHVHSAAELNDLVTTHDVVFVDFYADWCGPCQMLEPVVESLAASTDAAVAKVDIDEQQELAMKYRVQSVPTMYLFSGGEPVEQVMGVQQESQLRSLIQQYS